MSMLVAAAPVTCTSSPAPARGDDVVAQVADEIAGRLVLGCGGGDEPHQECRRLGGVVGDGRA